MHLGAQDEVVHLSAEVVVHLSAEVGAADGEGSGKA